MTEMPRAHYAKAIDGVQVGYWTLGAGPPDVLLCPDTGSNLDFDWEFYDLRHLYERLAARSRVIAMNRRGVGISDPVPLAEFATVESWVSRRVMSSSPK
jgi:pimeloyl-ACP methyl ester carboxylesterase